MKLLELYLVEINVKLNYKGREINTALFVCSILFASETMIFLKHSLKPSPILRVSHTRIILIRQWPQAEPCWPLRSPLHSVSLCQPVLSA